MTEDEISRRNFLKIAGLSVAEAAVWIMGGAWNKTPYPHHTKTPEKNKTPIPPTQKATQKPHHNNEGHHVGATEIPNTGAEDSQLNLMEAEKLGLPGVLVAVGLAGISYFFYRRHEKD
jgi:hypothetical protein